MKELMFFDANCRLGRFVNGGPCAEDAPALLREMDYYGVDRALVRFNNLAMSGTVTANCGLAEMLKADSAKRLTGVWCILPSQCDEIPEPDEFFRRMKANRIGALTLLPAEHRYVPCRMTLGKIMDAAAERKVPVLLNGFAARWPELYQFMETFPRNVYIFQEATGKWGNDRLFRPLLENFEKFYFETTGYWVPEGIRDLAERYGADRILYGSGFPRYNQGNGMLQLRQSGLPLSSIELIAGRNLERILGGAEL
ncbi:MAG: amidohydrolase family protein [Victivallales bacterium]|nr:amidohydrolase family protein [Victivallales bacterium]